MSLLFRVIRVDVVLGNHNILERDYERVEGMPPDLDLGLNTEGTVDESLGKVLHHLLKREAGELGALMG